MIGDVGILLLFHFLHFPSLRLELRWKIKGGGSGLIQRIVVHKSYRGERETESCVHGQGV